MRFLTPDRVSILDDTLTNIDACNLYVYCNNNPVMYVDLDGEMAKVLEDNLRFALFAFSTMIAGMTESLYDLIEIIFNIINQ